MIFVCVGSREYLFNRLINEIDILVEEEIISDVFGQIGTSSYIPKNFKFKRFLSSEEFQYYQKKADLIISHGGTGALIGALKKGKQVIAVPRLEKYGEHTDNHQLQVSSVLAENGYLEMVTDINQLGETIINMRRTPIEQRYNRPSNVLNIVNTFISREL